MAEPLVKGPIIWDDVERDPLDLLQNIAERLTPHCHKQAVPELWEIHNELWLLLRALRGVTDEEEMELMP